MKFKAGDRVKIFKSGLDKWCNAVGTDAYYGINNDIIATLKNTQISNDAYTMWSLNEKGNGYVFPEDAMEKIEFKSGDRVKINISKLKEFVKKEGLLESAYRNTSQEDFIATLTEIYHDKWSSTAWSVASPDDAHIYPEYAMEPIMNTKYKIVLKDASKNNERVTVNYEFLEKNQACAEAKIAFVKRYGNTTHSVKDVIKDIYQEYGTGVYGYHRNDTSIIFDPITKTHHAAHLRNLDNEHKQWIDWLITKTGYMKDQKIDESKYILLKNADPTKIYVMNIVGFSTVFKIYLITDEKIYYVSMRGSIKQDIYIKNLSPDTIIYEFENEEDFAEWYYNKIKES